MAQGDRNGTNKLPALKARGATRGFPAARTFATTPFLAQIIGEGLAKRRLAAAREAAGEINARYSNTDEPVQRAGHRLSLSI